MLTRYLKAFAWTVATAVACWLIAGDQLTPQHAEALGALTSIDPVLHPDLVRASMTMGIMAAFAIVIPVIGFPLWAAHAAVAEIRHARAGAHVGKGVSAGTAACCAVAVTASTALLGATLLSVAWDALMLAGMMAAAWNFRRPAREAHHAR